MRFEFMTMEETFVVAFVGTAILGIALGFLAYWLFEKERKEE